MSGAAAGETDTDRAAVRLLDVHVTYEARGEQVHALDGIDLACAAGSTTAVVGRSGSGKSTLISVMSLLRRPTRGRVVIDGVDTSDLRAADRAAWRAAHIGIVFQAFHLEPSLTVLDNVTLGWNFRHAGLGRRAAAARALEDLEGLGVADLARRRPHALSGGQRQRIAVARALFTRPRLLVADEPTGNLDEDNAQTVTDLLLGLPARYGNAVVVVTHDAQVAARADRRLELARGRILHAHA